MNKWQTITDMEVCKGSLAIAYSWTVHTDHDPQDPWTCCPSTAGQYPGSLDVAVDL